MDSTRLLGKAKAILLIIFLLFGALGVRLWHLQIVMGETFSRLSHENRVRSHKLPSPRGIIYDRNGKPLVKNSPYYFVALMPELARNADIRDIADFLNMDATEVANIIGAVKDPLEPIRIKGGLTPDEVAFIEARLSDHPGLLIVAEETRHYIYGPVGSHLIGYLGKLNPQQASRKGYRDVPHEAFIGQWGVEKMYDSVLRGIHGRQVIEVDALGRNLRILRQEPPTKGKDVYLAVDIDLQQAAEEAFDNKVGALVAIRPSTGELLALVSRPSYDPNLFSRGIDYEEWQALMEHPGFPLLNRALQSQYPPGSTFKLITALAALEENIDATSHKETCTGVHHKGRWSFRCWRRGGHGVVDMKRSIVESCDVYYYRTGERIGIDAIAAYARKLGLGSETGIGLIREKSGLIPDREWKQRTRGESWYPGETYNAAIGQGFVLTTPIQLAQMTATLVNGGYRFPLSVLRVDTPVEPLDDLHLNFEHVDFLKNALRSVVTDEHGTGKAARSRYVEIGGKTGTAQVISSKDVKESELPENLRDHAWFIAFAPVEEPEIAMAVFVENGGHGGSAAAPIARKAIEAYLAKEKLRQQKRLTQKPQTPEEPIEQKPRPAPRSWRDLLREHEILNATGVHNTPAPPVLRVTPVEPAPVEPAPVEPAPVAPVPVAPPAMDNTPAHEPVPGQPEQPPPAGDNTTDDNITHEEQAL